MPDRIPPTGARAGALALIMCCAMPGLAQEDPATMQSEVERAQELPPGSWHGQWRLVRDHPELRTIGTSLALQIEVWHGQGDASAEVQWLAGPALCPEVGAETCEWAGGHGSSRAQVIDGGLLFPVRVSADSSDPLMIHLPAPVGERLSRGVAGNAGGDFGFPLEAEPQRHW